MEKKLSVVGRILQWFKEKLGAASSANSLTKSNQTIARIQQVYESRSSPLPLNEDVLIKGNDMNQDVVINLKVKVTVEVTETTATPTTVSTAPVTGPVTMDAGNGDPPPNQA